MSSADCGAPSVAADRSTSIGPSSPTSTLLALSLPWEMPAAWSRATCRHEVLERLVAHLSGLDELERLDVRLARDHERVALGAEPDGDDLGHPDAGLRGHQRRQRLVLDLLEPPDGALRGGSR